MSCDFDDYTVHVYWHEVYRFFVAEIPVILFCTGDGSTHEEAIAGLRTNFELMKEVAEEEGKSWPEPIQDTFVTSIELKKAAHILKLARIATEAGMSPQTLHSKIKRNTKLNPAESRKLSSVLSSSGLFLCRLSAEIKAGSKKKTHQGSSKSKAARLARK